MDPPEEHKRNAPAVLTFAILTVSDSRSLDNDASGDEVERMVDEAGHAVAPRMLVRDEMDDIRREVERAARDPAVHVVVVTGGTGVGPRDVTPEAVGPLFEKRLPGFGELFRMLSMDEVGSAAMLSRAEAGIVGGKPVFLLPGSTKACRLAMARLVLPEAGHLASLRSPRR